MKKLLIFIFLGFMVAIVSLSLQNNNSDELFFIPDGNIAYATDPNTTVPVSQKQCYYKPGGSCPGSCNHGVALPENVCKDKK